MRILSLLFVFLFASSSAQDFVIKKGAFAPTPNPISWHGVVNSLDRTVIFDSSCIYHLGTYDDSDINKLYGWGTGFSNSSSLRMGWNCKSGYAIDLYAYIHYNNKRWTIVKDSIIEGAGQLIGKGFLPNKPIQCFIERTNKELIFTAIQGLKYGRMRIRFANFPNGPGWYLYPWFGGTSRAPHTIKISIKALP